MLFGTYIQITHVGVLLVMASAMFWIAYQVSRKRVHLSFALFSSSAWTVIGLLAFLGVRLHAANMIVGTKAFADTLFLAAALIGLGGLIVLLSSVRKIGYSREADKGRFTASRTHKVAITEWILGITAVMVYLMGLLVFGSLHAEMQVTPDAPLQEMLTFLFGLLVSFRTFLLLLGVLMAYFQVVHYRLREEER